MANAKAVKKTRPARHPPKRPASAAITHEQWQEWHYRNVHQGGAIAVYRMFNRYFFKSLFGPALLFFVPIVLYGILGKVISHEYMLPGMVAFGTTLASTAALPFAVIELRKSVMLKRIGSSPVRPSVFTYVLTTYFGFMNLIAALWIMLWGYIFFQDAAMFAPLGTVTGFFGFLYGLLLNIVLSTAVGFLIATFAKSSLVAQSIGLTLALTISFMCGQIIWIGNYANSAGVTWFTRFLPFRYTTMNLYQAWTGDTYAPVFNAATGRFVTDAAGSPVFHQIGSGNAFAVAPYVVPKQNVLDATAYNANFDILYKVDPAFAQAYRERVVGANYDIALTVYAAGDHVAGYVTPYVVAAGCIALAIWKFKWTDR